jgi:hypothetical protein
MSDNLTGLPRFPTEESKSFEETIHQLHHLQDRPDRLIDRLRHAWPVYTIFGGSLGLWLIALTVVGLGFPG